MGMPGATELLIIFGALVLLFGASKLPKLGGAIGESIKNFKKGIKGDEESDASNADDSDRKLEAQDDRQGKAQ